MRKWFIRCLSMIISITLVIGTVAWIVDPYFHFHKPFSFLSYRLYEERYTNDGISRHFEYDTIITHSKKRPKILSITFAIPFHTPHKKYVQFAAQKLLVILTMAVVWFLIVALYAECIRLELIGKSVTILT